jgi:hypothetical protein
MRLGTAIVGVLGCGVAVACAQPTQLLVVVENSDVPVSRYTAIDIEARTASGAVLDGGRASLGARELPISFAVVPAGPATDAAISVRVVADEGTRSHERMVATRFRPGRRLVVYVDLAASCDAVTCEPDETCRAGSCEVIPDLRDPPLASDAAGVDARPAPDAGGDAPDAPVPCEDECDGSALARCDGSRFECGAMGCESLSGADRCAAIAPSITAIDPDWFVEGTATLTGGSDIYELNTESGEIKLITGGDTIRTAGEGLRDGIGFHVVSQTTGPALGVFAFRAITLSGARLRFAGANAVAILAAGDISANAGEIDVSATRATPGPGGYAGAGITTAVTSGVGPGGGARGENNMNFDGGGGGGGHGDRGGDGGAATTMPAAGGLGGPSYSRSVLEGGSGGANARTGSGADYAGGGGGALYLGALGTISIGAAFVIDAGGAGGGPTIAFTTGLAEARGAGGHGGGAGGLIVIEAPAVLCNGVLAANGGGGSGGSIDGATGGAGGDGTRGTARASGGTGGAAARNGGRGGAASSTAGENGGTDADAGGGGGGAVGRIFVSAMGPPSLAGATASPSPTLSSTLARR